MNICCGSSSEPSHGDGFLGVPPQHMFQLRNNENDFKLFPIIHGPELLYIVNHYSKSCLQRPLTRTTILLVMNLLISEKEYLNE